MERFIYFDHAATSYPKPPEVLGAIKSAMLEKGGNPGRSSHRLSQEASRAIFECREAVCELLSFNYPERIVFTQNTTYALNMAIKGIARPGSHILISNFEHNSVLRPVHALSRTGRISYSTFDATGTDEQTVFSFRHSIRDNTRLAVVTLASNICGRILPIKEISTICKSKGITLIADGAQAAGVMPLDFSLLGVDILCLAGHKGLYGPQGTGIMICSPDVEPEAIIEGGNGINSDDAEMNGLLPERLEAGTLNTPGICGLCAGIRYIIRETPESVFAKNLKLTRYITEGLSVIDGIKLYGEYDIKAPVILFNKRDIPCSRVSEILNDEGIFTRSGLHCAPLAHTAIGTANNGGVRVSTGHTNTLSQAQRFLSVINKI